MLITKEKMLEIAQEDATEHGREYVVYQNRLGWDFAWAESDTGKAHLQDKDAVLVSPK